MNKEEPRYLYKQVIVMRKDLNMRTGKKCSQAAHASMAAILPCMDDPRVKGWLAGRFAKITVSVNSEEEMLEIYNKANEKGLITSIIEDAGFTEFNGVPTKTCIAIGPDLVHNIDEITGSLKLL